MFTGLGNQHINPAPQGGEDSKSMSRQREGNKRSLHEYLATGSHRGKSPPTQVATRHPPRARRRRTARGTPTQAATQSATQSATQAATQAATQTATQTATQAAPHPEATAEALKPKLHPMAPPCAAATVQTGALTVDFGNSPSLRGSCTSRLQHLRPQQLRILDLASSTLAPEERASHPGCGAPGDEALPAHAHLKEISKYLTRLPHDSLTSVAALARFANTRDVTVLHRAWEEKFLHEPSGNERPCSNRASRSCFAASITNNGIKDQDFGLCEFYTEVEYAAIRKSGYVWPVALLPCLLCLRAEAFARFLETRCNSVGCASNLNYARVSNIVGQVGEYVPESCFLSSSKRYEGIVDPIVIPNVRDYEIKTVCGIRHLQQLHPRPEHVVSRFFFFAPPTKSG